MQLNNQKINQQATNHFIGSGTTVPFKSRDNALAHAAQLYSSYLIDGQPRFQKVASDGIFLLQAVNHVESPCHKVLVSHF